jgi:hypothetical protein
MKNNKVFAALSHGIWQGVGVIITIILTPVTYYVSDGNEIWLYILGAIGLFLAFAFVLGAETQHRQSAATKMSIYLFATVCVLVLAYVISLILSSSNSNSSDASETEKTSANNPPVSITEEPIIENVIVAADKGWQSTNIRAEAGTRVTFRVIDGEWKAHYTFTPNNGTGNNTFDHWGSPLSETEFITDEIRHPRSVTNNTPLPGACIGALVAQVGERFVWIGSQRSFISQETDHIRLRINDPNGWLEDNEGFLTVEITLEPAQLGSHYQLEEVWADRGWQETDINISQGDRVTVEVVRGVWKSSKDNPYQQGEGNCYVCSQYNEIQTCAEPAPDFYKGALIARIGHEPDGIVAIGHHYSFTAQRDGKLFFRMNDSVSLDDNAGSVFVKVQIEQ